MTDRTQRALPAPCLMLVTDRTLCDRSTSQLVRAVSEAVQGGVNAVQVREKDLSPADQAELVRQIREEAGPAVVILLNGGPAVALAAGADGVHLPEDGMPVADLRRAVRGRLLIGRSVHALTTARQAAGDGADYLLLGTIFPSRSHPDGEVGGVERVATVSRGVQCPVIAVGGITAENAGSVMRAGAAGVAVISTILGTPDPRAAAAALWEQIQAATPTYAATT